LRERESQSLKIKLKFRFFFNLSSKFIIKILSNLKLILIEFYRPVFIFLLYLYIVRFCSFSDCRRCQCLPADVTRGGSNGGCLRLISFREINVQFSKMPNHSIMALRELYAHLNISYFKYMQTRALYPILQRLKAGPKN